MSAQARTERADKGSDKNGNNPRRSQQTLSAKEMTMSAQHHFLYASGATFGPIAVSLRTVIVYVAAIIIVRVGKKKFMGQHTGFDTLIAFILGSVLSRGINGTAPLPETLLAGFVLIWVHWAITIAAMRSSTISRMINGHAVEVVHEGTEITEMMKRHGVSHEDLMEAIRTNGRVETIAQVKTAWLERSGRISVIPYAK